MLFISQHNFKMNNIITQNDLAGKEKKFLDEDFDFYKGIILNNVGRPIYQPIDGEKTYKTCRFCGKTQDEVTFNHKSHVLPKFLGNFLVISNSECDECNSFFSRYETELEKYIKIPLIINKQNRQEIDLKDRYGKNISRIGDDILINGDKESVEFNGLYVLKIFLKFAYSLLPESELDNYKDMKNVLMDDDKDITPYIVDIIDMTVKQPFEINAVGLYYNRINDGKYCDNMLVLNFNMKKYAILFNRDGSKTKVDEDIIKEEYVKLFNDLDLNSFRVKKMNKDKIKITYIIKDFMKLIDL